MQSFILHFFKTFVPCLSHDVEGTAHVCIIAIILAHNFWGLFLNNATFAFIHIIYHVWAVLKHRWLVSISWQWQVLFFYNIIVPYLYCMLGIIGCIIVALCMISFSTVLHIWETVIEVFLPCSTYGKQSKTKHTT